MLSFTIRRLLAAIPTLLLISLVIFLLVDLAPGSPLSDIPLTVPPDVRQKMIEAMGADQPVMVRYVLWLKQFFWIEPQYALDAIFGTNFADGAQRIISWQSKVPVFQIIGERIPQTLTVVGTAYLIGVLIALPGTAWLSGAEAVAWTALGLAVLGRAVAQFIPATPATAGATKASAVRNSFVQPCRLMPDTPSEPSGFCTRYRLISARGNSSRSLALPAAARPRSCG